MKVKLTPSGVIVSVEAVFTDSAKIQELINQLTQAKEQLIEHQARTSEEGKSELWESV